MLEQGWEVHIACDITGQEPHPDLDGIQIHSLPMERNPSLLRDIVSFFLWYALLRQVRPHILAVGTPKASLLGLVSALLARVPLRVYQLRGLRLQTESGPKRWLLHILEKVTSQCATHIVAVSESLRSEYIRSNLSGKKNVTVLGFGSSHGVDTDYFHPDRWADWVLPDQHKIGARRTAVLTLGFVGRLSSDKGAEDLLWCHRILQERGIDHRLLIIGPNEADDAIQEQLKSDYITVVGSVPNVAPYYSLIDLLVLPTRREGFPNVVLEAAASGIPTVTTSATGAIDSVLNDETGVIVPVGDREALASAVESLLLDHQLRRKYGQNARTWAITHFEAGSVTSSHANFLLELWWASRPTQSPAPR